MNADMALEGLGTGVEGIRVLGGDGVVHFPVIMATDPGSGDVGRWLDALPTDQTFRIPGVISEVLDGMLQRRNWKKVSEFAPEYGEFIDVYERKASSGE